MTKPPSNQTHPFGPGTVLGSDTHPYQSLIHGESRVGEAPETSEVTPLGSEFIRDDQARRFGRQIAEVNPPLDPSKIFRG